MRHKGKIWISACNQFTWHCRLQAKSCVENEWRQEERLEHGRDEEAEVEGEEMRMALGRAPWKQAPHGCRFHMQLSQLPSAPGGFFKEVNQGPAHRSTESDAHLAWQIHLSSQIQRLIKKISRVFDKQMIKYEYLLERKRWLDLSIP